MNTEQLKEHAHHISTAWDHPDNGRIILSIILSLFLSRFIMYIIVSVTISSWNPADFIERMNIWDAKLYYDICTGGYGMTPDGNITSLCAFFPLYPALIFLLHKIIPINIYTLASILSTCFLAAAEYAAYQYILLTRKNPRQGILFIYLMSFGVYSFYFSVFYTEALYLMLLILCFYFMKQRKYITMGICGALLSATRNTGVFFVFAVLCHCIMEYQRQAQDKSIRGFFSSVLKKERLVLGTVLIPLGLFSYMLYLKHIMGDGLAFVHIQKDWGRTFKGLFHVLWDGIVRCFPPDYLAICLLIGIYLIWYLCFCCKRYDEAVIPALTLLVSSVTALGSIPRFMISSFTLLLCFTDLYQNYSRQLKCFILICAFLMELIMTSAWVQNVTILI